MKHLFFNTKIFKLPSLQHPLLKYLHQNTYFWNANIEQKKNISSRRAKPLFELMPFLIEFVFNAFHRHVRATQKKRQNSCRRRRRRRRHAAFDAKKIIWFFSEFVSKKDWNLFFFSSSDEESFSKMDLLLVIVKKIAEGWWRMFLQLKKCSLKTDC